MKWQARDKGSSEGSQGGDKHWESRFIAKSEEVGWGYLGFGMINTSGRALWSRLGKSIMPKFISSLPKVLPFMAVGLFTSKLYSCTIILIGVCVYMLWEAKLGERILHMIR